jgi:hypothetical protein
MSWSRKARLFLIAAALIGIAAVARAPAGAQTAAPLTGVTITGDAVVGQTLTAVPAPPDAAVTEYRWRRCPTANTCARIQAAPNQPTYTVVAADVGSQLEVRALSPTGNARSARTAVVTDPTAPTPTPTPTPTATPTPTPTATPTPRSEPQPRDEPKSFEQAGRQSTPPEMAVPATDLASKPLAYMHPFPVVRVKGYLIGGGARITYLRVKGPSTAKVGVRCDGPGCPLRRRSFGIGRIRPLERFLPAGVRITIRVFRTDAVGKYVRLVIRDGLKPKRRDACLVARNTKPAECPKA